MIKPRIPRRSVHPKLMRTYYNYGYDTNVANSLRDYARLFSGVCIEQFYVYELIID